jgi:hypothetical protein
MYKVGQVLFLFVNNVLLPVQIVEEVIRRTVDGTQTTYLVDVPGQNTPVALTTLKGTVYVDTDTAYQEIMAKFSLYVKKLVEAAQKKANERYSYTAPLPKESHPFEETSDEGPVQTPPIGDTVDTYIELPNGTRAKVKLT